MDDAWMRAEGQRACAPLVAGRLAPRPAADVGWLPICAARYLRGSYRPDGEARHWVKAALVVRIISHPSPSRFAISCAVSAVIPHATLRARQALRRGRLQGTLVRNGSGSGKRYRPKSEPFPDL